MMNLMQESTENTTSEFLVELKESLRNQQRTLLNQNISENTRLE